MADGHITIRISAAADRSFESVFGGIEKKALRIRDVLNRTMSGAGTKGLEQQSRAADKTATAAERAAKRAADAQGREAARATREVEKSYRQQQAALDKAARAKDAIFERQARNQQRIRDRETREAIRSADKQARAAEIWQRKNAYRTAYHGVIRYFPGAVGHAARAAMDVARGAGVDWNLGSVASRVVDYSSQVTRLQNQAAMNDQLIARPALESTIKGAADRYGFSRGETAGALENFAAKTGDTQLGMQLLDRVAARAAASGANLDDMMNAAGDAASNIGNVKDKAGAVVSVLDDWTVQGAKGAVEMKDLASKAARLASPAARFEGDAGSNMGKLGALAQLARQSGGAASASEATNAVARFADQLRTPARVKQFKALGIDTFSKTEKGQLRDPFEVITEAVTKTKGDPMALKKLFASSIGDKPVQALASAYNHAGGGAAGEAAVKNRLGEFMNTGNIEAKIAAANERRDQDVKARAQKFQNALDDVGQKVMADLQPKFEALSPKLLELAGTLGDVSTWVIENPKTAIAAAFTASIARAGLESAVRQGLETAIAGSAARGLTFGGPANIAAASVAIAAMAVAIDQAQSLKKDIGSDSWLGMLPGFNGKGDFEGIDKLWKDMNTGVGDIYFNKAEKNLNAKAREDAIREGRMLPDGTFPAVAQQWKPVAPNAGGAAAPQKVSAEIDHTQLSKAIGNELRAALAGGVYVKNMPTNGPQVDDKGRSPK